MWIIITLAAVVSQVARTALQHRLRHRLSSTAAGLVRFAYGAPFALALSAAMFGLLGRTLPKIPEQFWGWVVMGSLCQIVGTVALLASFRVRDFAIGTVYSKSEVLIVAGLGAVGLGEALQPGGWLGAVLVTVGVGTLAADGSLLGLLRRSGDRAALLGLVAGAGFGGAAVGIGAASRSLTDAPAFDRAVLTLTVLLALQAVVNGTWLGVRHPAELAATARAWRSAIPVGALSLMGSIGWAWAFTLESPAKVRTLGQVELLIAFGVSYVFLGERHRRWELWSGAAVLVGIVLVTVLG